MPPGHDAPATEIPTTRFSRNTTKTMIREAVQSRR